MLPEERNVFNNPWSMLQQPSHASQGLPASFRAFLAALDQGWQLSGPARVLPTAQGEGRLYRFELVHPAYLQTRQIDVQAAPAIARYLEQNNIPLDGVIRRDERLESR